MTTWVSEQHWTRTRLLKAAACARNLLVVSCIMTEHRVARGSTCCSLQNPSVMGLCFCPRWFLQAHGLDEFLREHWTVTFSVSQACAWEPQFTVRNACTLVMEWPRSVKYYYYYCRAHDHMNEPKKHPLHFTVTRSFIFWSFLYPKIIVYIKIFMAMKINSHTLNYSLKCLASLLSYVPSCNST